MAPDKKKKSKRAAVVDDGTKPSSSGAPAAKESTTHVSERKRAAKSAIDDIFSGKKKKEQSSVQPTDTEGGTQLTELGEKIKEARTAAKVRPLAGLRKVLACCHAWLMMHACPQGAKAKVVGSKDDIFGEKTGTRKRTTDGLAIYTEEELGLGPGKGGGDTDLCPFDCDCCY